MEVMIFIRSAPYIIETDLIDDSAFLTFDDWCCQMGCSKCPIMKMSLNSDCEAIIYRIKQEIKKSNIRPHLFI